MVGMRTGSLVSQAFGHNTTGREAVPQNALVGATYGRPLVPLSEGTPVRIGRDQNVNVWMQVYELGVDEKTNKASATVEYDIASTAKNDSAIHILESVDQMENIGKQITLKKTLPAANLQPDAYKLRVQVHDNISRQVFERSTTFAIELYAWSIWLGCQL
jgi:hypothetical protein